MTYLLLMSYNGLLYVYLVLSIHCLKYLKEHLIIFHANNVNPSQKEKQYTSLDNKAESQFFLLCLMRKPKYQVTKCF